MAIGLTLVIVVGEIDLSFGAMYGLAANTLAVLWILLGVPVYPAIPLAIGVGALVGLFNGVDGDLAEDSVLHCHAGQLQPALRAVAVDHQHQHLQPQLSAARRRSSTQASSISSSASTAMSARYQLSVEIFWMLGIAVVVGFLLHRSLFGFRLMAIGGNPEAGQLARLPVNRYKILAFILCAMLAAIAGILDFSFIQTSQPDIGLSQTFPVFAAVIIGGASL